MRPEYIPLPKDLSLSLLPIGLTVDDVLSHFFIYIKENVQMFVANSYSSANKYWDEFAEKMVVVLTTPNGWEGKHQNLMREAAINAKLLLGDRVRERVRFVSEGEVSLIILLKLPKYLIKFLHRLLSIMHLMGLNHMAG